MDTRRALLVDAFTDEPLAGNAAGVIPEAADLTDAQMQAVARELAVSETAFLLPPSDSEADDESVDHRLRYFTPTQEIDLCGHATVATHAHLFEDGVLDAGTYRVETAVGVVDVELTDEGRVWMTQATPEIRTVEVDYDRVGEALGIDPAALRDVGADLPVAVASTGVAFLVVPVNFLEHVGGADPDMDAVAELAAEYDAGGVYVFTFDALDAESALHARAFAPGLGIPEDPVTGVASGACGAYLHVVDAFDDAPGEMRFEQGHFVDRPGYVHVRVGDAVPDDGSAVEDTDDAGVSVRVGGRAVTSLDGSIVVPADEDGDIIEV